jgi:hypothetical protein
MLQKLKNLWAWSNIDPYELGKETGRALVEATRHEPAEIIYPNRVTEVLKDNPEASLDQLLHG